MREKCLDAISSDSFALSVDQLLKILFKMKRDIINDVCNQCQCFCNKDNAFNVRLLSKFKDQYGQMSTLVAAGTCAFKEKHLIVKPKQTNYNIPESSQGDEYREASELT